MSLRHSILGLLSIQPMSGYDLKKVIDTSVGHFWAADQSQIYRTLAALVDDGLASRRTVVQEDRPNFHRHSATDQGLAELDRWLASPLQAQPTRDPFLARLFFAPRMPMDQMRELLETRRREVSEQLAALEAISVVEGAPENVTEIEHAVRLATLSNGIAHARTEIDWINATEQHLESVTS